MDDLFSALFGYKWFQYTQGSLSFQPVIPFSMIWLLGLAAAVWTWFSCRHLLKRGRRFLWLLALRLLFLALATGILLNPKFELTRMVPQTGSLAVLVDDSQSMGITASGRKRGDPVREAFGEGGAVRRGLEHDFEVRYFSFAGSVRPMRELEELDWDGVQTNLAAALDHALAERSGKPLAAAILVTDGAQTVSQSLAESIDAYVARKIPVYTVGVGPTEVSPDVELQDVSVPADVPAGSVVPVRAAIRHPGFRGKTVRFEVRDGTSLLAATEVVLSQDSDLTVAEVRLFPEFTGVKSLDADIVTSGEERILQNNTRKALVNVREDRPRILLVEGRPRWEFKFIRQAMEGDRLIRLESLLRTALNKFYRQGIADEGTLEGGFPAQREELFGYDGLILGDVEASFFTYAQMEMINDFVARRGGGLLALGGSHALGVGGFQNTPIEAVLPVYLESARGSRPVDASYSRAESRVELTPAGGEHPVLQLDRDPAASLRLWQEIPNLSDLNEADASKPGATVLLSALPKDSRGAGKPGSPLLVGHRYGRGLGVAFLTGSSWRWQMLRDSRDRSFETFWRQLCRWLVSSAKQSVTVETDRTVYPPRESVRITADVRDKTFVGINNSTVTALVADPSGHTEEVRLALAPGETGIYTADWTPSSDGLHSVEVLPETDSGRPGSARTWFQSGGLEREYFDSAQKEDLLKDIAERTGGRYYPVEEVGQLPDEIVYGSTEGAVTESLGLWNIPANILLLFVLLGGEWVLRRRWGLI